MNRVMSDDDDHKPHHATARPPPGEEDVYSASTVAGEASDELLAIIRQSADAPKAAIPGAPKVPSVDLEAKSEPKVEVRADALPAPPAKPEMKTDASNKPAYLPTPPEVPVSRDVVVTPEPEAEEPIAKTATAPHAPATKEKGLPPALGIVLFFIAVVAVLAALIR